MPSTRSTNTTSAHGEITYGTAFDDISCITNFKEAAISRIVVTHDTYIRSLTVHYSGGVAATRGQSIGSPGEVALSPGEFITKVEGTVSGGAISKLLFVSDKGTKWGPFGQSSITSTFTWDGFGPHMGLLYFSGQADSYIRRLQATFAKYGGHEQPPRVVLYEEQVGTGPDGKPAAGLSKFAQNLISPTATLVVGAGGIEFHACESILCSLPFFRAALQGGFREATEKKVAMPEDEPGVVSALIEFMYNGSYTYTYRPAEATGSGTPPGDLAEGSFHVDVYAIASKYDCQPLADAAVRCFMYVLNKLTDDFDVILLWETAYAKGLSLSQWEDDDGLAEFKKGLSKVLKGLYSTQREKMDSTLTENSALANDLLRLVVSSGSGA